MKYREKLQNITLWFSTSTNWSYQKRSISQRKKLQ